MPTLGTLDVWYSIRSAFVIVTLSDMSAMVLLQARGLKKHMKRLNAPKHWMLDKLGGAFVSERVFYALNHLLCSFLVAI